MVSSNQLLEAPNINKGVPYEHRVCIVCKGEPSHLSNYCKPCYNLFKQELIKWANATRD